MMMMRLNDESNRSLSLYFYKAYKTPRERERERFGVLENVILYNTCRNKKKKKIKSSWWLLFVVVNTKNIVFIIIVDLKDFNLYIRSSLILHTTQLAFFFNLFHHDSVEFVARFLPFQRILSAVSLSLIFCHQLNLRDILTLEKFYLNKY